VINLINPQDFPVNTGEEARAKGRFQYGTRDWIRISKVAQKREKELKAKSITKMREKRAYAP